MGYALKKEYLPNYTYSDYELWEGKWELIDGIPYAMSPSPAFKHQKVSLKIAKQLDELLEGCSKCEPVEAFDWKVDEKNVIQPDVSVICKPVKNQNYLDFAPVLIFEIVSPSSVIKDRDIKFNIYQSEGVKYYVIVDLEKQVAEIFELIKKTYKPALSTKDKKFIFNFDGCKANFDFSKIWK